ncbi:CIC11C00000003489 [Sungouiella intermedia]|uniref:CIC11C00000003489 n=1 Tax=Sungouiella intermedia TaxID=45354 RepID=A0A1L0BVI4_9ASCO|nr:CIC11C00000003489 [[Candida] intermedia]
MKLFNKLFKSEEKKRYPKNPRLEDNNLEHSTECKDIFQKMFVSTKAPLEPPMKYKIAALKRKRRIRTRGSSIYVYIPGDSGSYEWIECQGEGLECGDFGCGGNSGCGGDYGGGGGDGGGGGC